MTVSCARRLLLAAAITALGLAAVPASATTNIAVAGNDAARIDFSFGGTAFGFYRLRFEQFAFDQAITGLDAGEAYKLEFFDRTNISLGVADSFNRTPYLDPPSTLGSFYAILSATGASNFQFDPGFTTPNSSGLVTGIFGQSSGIDCDIVYPCRIVGGNPSTASATAVRLASIGEENPNPGGSVVPEPESWAMLIAGFGMVGAVMRRRRVALA
jgi:hypothetical protein